MADLSRYLRPYWHSSPWIWAAVLLLACMAAWLAGQAYELHTQALETQDRVEKLLARQAELAKFKPTPKELDELKRWTALKLERDFPWQKVFKAVERANSKDIELLEFQPDKRNRVIVLRGEARDLAALVSYLERLTLQAGLREVYLVHQQTVARDRLETVSFEIKATLSD